MTLDSQGLPFPYHRTKNAKPCFFQRWSTLSCRAICYYALDVYALLHLTHSVTFLASEFEQGPCAMAKRFTWAFLQVIENMAVQTLLLNQDRCTKNYNMYYDKAGTKEWQMMPWDLEESLGISSGLGGKPAPDYCILECQQWNSPLYCDWNHTQVRLCLAMLSATAPSHSQVKLCVVMFR